MTNSELNKLYYLNREISRIDDQIALLESPSLTPNLSGMPHAPGISDRVASAAIKLTSLRLKREAARLDVIDEVQRLTDFIEGIPDPLMRQIMQYRHVNGLKWERVAELIGNGMTGESCRVLHWRYLNGGKA